MTKLLMLVAFASLLGGCASAKTNYDEPGPKNLEIVFQDTDSGMNSDTIGIDLLSYLTGECTGTALGAVILKPGETQSIAIPSDKAMRLVVAFERRFMLTTKIFNRYKALYFKPTPTERYRLKVQIQDGASGRELRRVLVNGQTAPVDELTNGCPPAPAQ
jgi:hypothetical protein